MKNFRQNVEKITVVATSVAAVSGNPYFSHADTIKGIAEGDAAIGEKVVLATEGVFRLKAADADEVTLGEALYWDQANSQLTTTVVADKLVGTAFTAKASATAGEVEVLVTK